MDIAKAAADLDWSGRPLHHSIPFTVIVSAARWWRCPWLAALRAVTLSNALAGLRRAAGRQDGDHPPSAGETVGHIHAR